MISHPAPMSPLKKGTGTSRKLFFDGASGGVLGASPLFQRTAMTLLLTIGLAGNCSYGQSDPYEGYTLYNALNSDTAYLIDLEGDVVHSWIGANQPASTPYLFPDGSILRPTKVSNPPMQGSLTGGRIQIIDWDGAILWDYLYSDDNHQPHHDITPLPSGNVLLVAWERKSRDEAITMGRVSIDDEMWPTEVIEVQPDGETGGTIVWEWHAWDHLIQDVDSDKPGYGVVADHPELLDTNVGSINDGDWIHVNGIDYNEQLDQIIISAMGLNEILIIDHSTTTAEAAGHTGGDCGVGGDLLYRWGNPQNYDRGDIGDKLLFGVHSVNWIDPGLSGEGNIMFFNNGNRPGGQNDYSSAEEIVPPLLVDGTYEIEDGSSYGPTAPIWIYQDPPSFYSQLISGASRLPNGNTLICEGTSGYLFEVTEQGEVVWDHSCGGNVMRAYRYDLDYLQSDCPADINADGTIDVLDLLEVLSQWGGSGSADVTGDGVVDVLDLLEVLAAWGPCS